MPVMENSGQLDARALLYVSIALLTWSSAYAAIAYGLAGFTPGEVAFARLLLGSGDAPDLQAFVREVTGPLIDYDSKNDGSLLRTLRAFFDADCSQRTAAERLFVHHKTLRYRLGRIQQLTGLDLGHHEDRMRADLALRLLQVNAGLDREDMLPESSAWGQ